MRALHVKTLHARVLHVRATHKSFDMTRSGLESLHYVVRRAGGASASSTPTTGRRARRRCLSSRVVCSRTAPCRSIRRRGNPSSSTRASAPPSSGSTQVRRRLGSHVQLRCVTSCVHACLLHFTIFIASKDIMFIVGTKHNTHTYSS